MKTPARELSEENPCRFCIAPKRKPGCHVNCEEREIWLKKHRDHTQIVWEQKRKIEQLNSYEKERADNIKKATKFAKGRR